MFLPLLNRTFSSPLVEAAAALDLLEMGVVVLEALL
jgi:hypothetical protein